MFMSSVDPFILIVGDRGIHLRLRATEQSSFVCTRFFLCWDISGWKTNFWLGHSFVHGARFFVADLFNMGVGDYFV